MFRTKSLVFLFAHTSVTQGEEFAAITPKRLQIPNVTAAAVVKAKIIRDMDKKPSTDVSLAEIISGVVVRLTIVKRTALLRKCNDLVPIVVISQIELIQQSAG